MDSSNVDSNPPPDHPLERLVRSASSPAEILRAVRTAGRRTLLEPEGLALARLIGFEVPELRIVHDAHRVREVLLDADGVVPDVLPDVAPDVVVKAISAELVHKSDAGGVVRVRRHPAAVAEAVRKMAAGLEDLRVEGYAIYDHVEHDRDLAGELIFGLRRTPDFGAVVSIAPGGVYAEHLAGALDADRGIAHVPACEGGTSIAARLRRLVVVPMLTGGLRGAAPRLALEQLVAAVEALHRLAVSEPELAELELNPVVVRGGRLVALDALARLAEPASCPGSGPAERPARPLAKLRCLLRPRSIAVVGVSARSRNPGRIVVDNVLAAGFPAERLWIVKPGLEQLDGCRCIPDLENLDPVDLLVVAVSAEKAASLVDEVVRRRVAASVLLIPGGVGELEGSEAIAGRIRGALDAARRGPDAGPLLCGGNCLGVRSRPGRFDSLFIPRHKMGQPDERSQGAPAGAGQLALISQSGAFAVARASQLDALDPRYVVTLGNQLDLTVGDVLTYLRDDDGTDVVACYVEGFVPRDGERFLRAAEELRRAGRPVILYRAGRTPAGASTAASHTASMAGDYALTRALAHDAGVVTAETLQEFDDLVSVFTLLHRRPPTGCRLGAVSNAGFECVAMADHLGGLELATLSPPTRHRLGRLLDAARVGDIVGVSNPLDTTPTFDDEAFVASARAVLDDGGVDLGVIGCVPLTGALDTLGEDVERPGSVASRLARLFGDTAKPWAAVVDGGPLYDAMARGLRRVGVPTFRHADRAVRALDAFRRWHHRHAGGEAHGRPT